MKKIIIIIVLAFGGVRCGAPEPVEPVEQLYCSYELWHQVHIRETRHLDSSVGKCPTWIWLDVFKQDHNAWCSYDLSCPLRRDTWIPPGPYQR